MPAQYSEALRLRYLQYTVRSDRQMVETTIRILEPDDLEKVERPRVLYVLPSCPELSHRSGDGLDQILRDDLHNRHGLVAVAPTFADWPWMTDLPDQQTLRQVLYFLEDVVGFVDGLYPDFPRLLIGYSKGGSAALQLLLRHPELFRAAAAFDSPIMKEQPDQWEMPYFWPNPQHFQAFALPHLLRTRGRLLGDAPRIALFGYGNFGKNAPEWSFDHLSAGHALLDELGLPHHYSNDTRREHRWDSGWLPEAVAALDQMSR
ncbi:alpha/beta hydrolase-fold protein [Nocardioidaceae bacterium SCSIO 66511]|nr:alpha/beta hydrolase-fold protein [Nocardioidaceae bacterium SCSIO 66511]